MTKDEALRLALEFIPSISPAFICEASHHKKHEQHASNELCPHVTKQKQVYEAIKAALEAKDEPVAWSHAGAMPPEQEQMKEAAYRLAPWLSAALDDPKVCQEYKNDINAWFDAAMPAPQRTWVGLTDEEILDKCESVPDYDIGNRDLIQFARAVEAKLKEKNNVL